MNWRALKIKISRMTDEQLDMDVTVHLSSFDECFPVDHLELSDENEDDRLDDGSPVLVVFDGGLRDGIVPGSV